MTAWDEPIRLRSQIMRDGLDLARLSGLEIGPLADPLVPRSDGRITYVDQADTPSLRRTYADNPRVDVERLVEVDAVWGERTLLECLDGRTVDYVMASHVAEHVPDLVTWLKEVREVLNPGGQVRLALPDIRFSPDALREETRLVDVLAAWILRARRPQVRDVLDFRLHEASAVDAASIFAGTAELGDVVPDHTFRDAYLAALHARIHADEYFDVHCLAVQAGSFARLMEKLAAHGLLQLACTRMIDTAPPLFEFYAFMMPCDDPMAVERSWRVAQSHLHDPLPGSAAARRVAEAAEARRHEERRVTELSQALSRAEAARIAAEAHAAEAVAAFEAIRRSRSWRITAPLRRIRARAHWRVRGPAA